MKKQLLDFYKKQKVGGRSYWKGELKNAVPDSEEKLDIYGMRLIELAQQAFPNSKNDSARQLRKHFLETISPHIATKIKDAERALRATTNSRNKYMQFTNIMQMAKELQLEDKQSKTVMWTHNPQNSQQFFSHNNSQDSHNHQQWYNNKQSHQQNGQSTYAKPRSQSAMREYRNSNTTRDVAGCTYCKKPNHLKKDCWRASNSCLICGKNHHLEQCPRFDPNFQKRTTGKSTEQRDLN